MGLSRLAEKCRKCPFVSKCDKKRMEAVAYLPDIVIAPASMPATGYIALPMAREVVERHAYGQVYVQYKDELEKELYKSLYGQFDVGLQNGG